MQTTDCSLFTKIFKKNQIPSLHSVLIQALLIILDHLCIFVKPLGTLFFSLLTFEDFRHLGALALFNADYITTVVSVEKTSGINLMQFLPDPASNSLRM